MRVYDVKLVKPRDVEKLVAVHTEHVVTVKDEEETLVIRHVGQSVERIREGQYV